MLNPRRRRKLDATEEEKEKFRAHVKAKVIYAIQGDGWVSDGFYSRVQPYIAERADTIIFLDFPVWQLLLNHISRTFQRRKRHIQLSLWQDITFLKEILYRRFRKGTIQKMQILLEQNKTKVVVLRSRKEIASYLNSLS